MISSEASIFGAMGPLAEAKLGGASYPAFAAFWASGWLLAAKKRRGKSTSTKPSNMCLQGVTLNTSDHLPVGPEFGRVLPVHRWAPEVTLETETILGPECVD